MQVSAATGSGGQDAAVLVGIRDYDQLVDRVGADTNVLAWATYMRDVRGVPSDRIHTLTNSEATKEHIQNALGQARRDVGKQGTLWFIFVGHSAVHSDTGEAHFLGADTRDSAQSFNERGVAHRKVIDTLARSDASHIVAVLDTTLQKKTVVGDVHATDLFSVSTARYPKGHPTFTAFVAGEVQQQAGLLHGTSLPALSYLVLGSLRGWADIDGNREITVREVYNYTYSTLTIRTDLRPLQTPLVLTSKPSHILERSARFEESPDRLALLQGTGTQHIPKPITPHVQKAERIEPPKGMVYVPAGNFQMGSNSRMYDEKPQNTVYLDAYFIDMYEVTVNQYKECVYKGPCSIPKKTRRYKVNTSYSGYSWGHTQRGDHPINGVDWQQAQTYCTWRRSSLPTEAQWEKAARGTDARTFPWGEMPLSCVYAVIDDGDAEGCGGGIAMRVGSRPYDVSPYGAYDMMGNVREWVLDWYDENGYWDTFRENPRGPHAGQYGVYRGSDYGTTAMQVDSLSFRGRKPRGDAGASVGFRCVQSP